MSPPPPIHVFRSHSYPLHATAFSANNQLLYAGDEEGWITITDLKVKRVVAHWRAHESGVLGVGEWLGGLVSHGRDNIIHFHAPLDPSHSQPTASDSSLTNLLQPPQIIRSLPVNSLNFCGFHLIPIPAGYELQSRHAEGPDDAVLNKLQNDSADTADSNLTCSNIDGKWFSAQGLLAVPNLTDSETIDIYHLPSFGRLHAAVGTRTTSANLQLEGKIRSGLVMSVRMYFTGAAKDAPVTDTNEGKNTLLAKSDPRHGVPALRLVAAYEDGRVEQWECKDWQKRSDPRLRASNNPAKAGGGGWQTLWTQKGHNEAIMAMAISPTLDYAYTVSADHLLVRYQLQTSDSFVNGVTGGSDLLVKHSTKQIGNSAVAVSPDGRVVAVGGWDGGIRLLSTKTFKSLGTLSYHRQSCHTISFPHNLAASCADDLHLGDHSSVLEIDGDDSEDDSDYETSDQKATSHNVMRWMVSGAKDRRLALWELKDFSRK
ncbi:hypothetical protein QFC21_005613 [Naganishia friedmannii]|uniref:Uncharacterized protein n=1 Tax=Naganishia friedmannii TaxID=89922 RepID=A0ACC2V8F5_9TREE|nr:hypothetical protein QFC21_005613 [Naganishia friedmannii]